MSMSVHWLDQAEDDLNDLYRYIGVEQHQISAAYRLIESIREKAASYARQPGMGTLHEEIEIPGIGGPIRSFRVKSYMAFYQEIDSGILVLRVVDGRRERGGLFG